MGREAVGMGRLGALRIWRGGGEGRGFGGWEAPVGGGVQGVTERVGRSGLGGRGRGVGRGGGVLWVG